MKNRNINPFWVIWMMVSAVFMFIGGIMVSNELGIKYLPQILLLIQIIFILYCYFPYKWEANK
jgi:hypothetical protein